MTRDADRILVHVAEVCRGQRPLDDATRAVLGPIADITGDLAEAMEALHLACNRLERVASDDGDAAAVERIKAIRTALELKHGEPIQTACEHGVTHMGPLHACDGCCTIGAARLEQARIARARATLYAPLDVFRRYGRMRPSDVCNRSTCPCRGGWVEFLTLMPKSLTDAQAALLGRIRAAAPEGALVEAREHAGKCNACACERSKLGVQVAIEFEGDSLMREYALDDEE